MSNIKELIRKTENHFNYPINRAIISGRILADLNDSPKVFSTKENFIHACLAYTDPKHEQIVKELKESIQTILADVKSNELFFV